MTCAPFEGSSPEWGSQLEGTKSHATGRVGSLTHRLKSASQGLTLPEAAPAGCFTSVSPVARHDNLCATAPDYTPLDCRRGECVA